MRLLFLIFFISLSSCGPNGGRDTRGAFTQTSSGGFANESFNNDPHVLVTVGCGSSQTCAMNVKINDIRAAHQKPALITDQACQQMAQAHAEDMAQNDYFDHLDLNGLNPIERIHEYGGNNASENIALGSMDVNMVAEMWMSTQGHRANILGDYRGTGVGSASSNKGTYWVQCFSR